jgi:hypothetical protein
VEAALIELARKSVETPARLGPGDLSALRGLVGDGAVDYTVVLGAFHYINRIADLLHVDSEALPESLRRFEFLRRMSVRIAGRMFRKMDLANRTFDESFEQALGKFSADYRDATGEEVGGRLEPLRARPQAVEALRLGLEERFERSTVDRETLAIIHRGVEAALPASAEEATGFYRRPSDPLEAFVFVGTRYAARTTAEMIEALRETGYADLGILDLAHAVADANQWARMSRLLDLDPALLSTAEVDHGDHAERVAGA